MNPPKLLRLLIFLVWSTAIVGVVLEFSLVTTLPTPLREYLNSELSGDISPKEWIGVIAALVALILSIKGSIQLYWLRENGRRPFLTGLAISVIAMVSFEALVYNPWSAALYEASLVLSGVIVGWLYLVKNGSPFE